jgi:mono/diheme cytochrome c family protein
MPYPTFVTSVLRSRHVARTLFVATAVAAAVGLASCGEQGPATPTLSASASRGAVVFAQYCQSCHPGGGRGAGPSLVQSGISREEFVSTVRQGKGRMPAFNAGLIPDDDLNAMYDYISSLSK